MITSLKTAMMAHAQSAGNEEACGLIAGDQYWPCTNKHSSPLENFAIDAQDYARLEPLGIQAVFHSHTGFNAAFSKHDIASCKQTNLPWVMYCNGANSWQEMDPTGSAPCLGRPWIYGIYDCYGLWRDYYKQEFQLELDDFDRGEEFEWESSEWRMFERNFASQGFVEIEGGSNLRKGDIILMQLQASFPNHAGIIHSPNENIFYQHLLGRLSEANVYGGYWKKNTVKALRHSEMF
jgi:proteasome lid subunit RPN8/RPN11